MINKIELCKICKINMPSCDNRLIKYAPLTIKEPCPTCDNCKEFWLKSVSEFIGSKNDKGGGIYTFEDGTVKEISEEEWIKENPHEKALRYYK